MIVMDHPLIPQISWPNHREGRDLHSLIERGAGQIEVFLEAKKPIVYVLAIEGWKITMGNAAKGRPRTM